MDIEEIWPLYALRLTAGDLELRVVRPSDVPELVDLVLSGVHDPALMPFTVPWTDAPDDELPAAYYRYVASVIGCLAPGDWKLEMAGRERGTLVGVQALSARDFPVTRTAETGSWLARRHQGRGVGTRMRQMACAFAFDHLGAEQITSGAFLDNPASLGVSRKVGYRPNGVARCSIRGAMALSQRLVLDPADLVRGESVTVEGADAVRRFLGIDAA